jgi:hypothetical protein
MVSDDGNASLTASGCFNHLSTVLCAAHDENACYENEEYREKDFAQTSELDANRSTSSSSDDEMQRLLHALQNSQNQRS